MTGKENPKSEYRNPILLCGVAPLRSTSATLRSSPAAQHENKFKWTKQEPDFDKEGDRRQERGIPSLIFLLFKNFYISTQYKIDPSGSGDCITESKVGTEPGKVDREPPKVGTEPPKVDREPPKVGMERGKVGTEPHKVATEPPKLGSERGKVDTEPPKVDTEPGKVGTEPHKVDAEPGKVGTEPPKVGTEPG